MDDRRHGADLQGGGRELRGIVPVCGIVLASIAMLSLTGYAFGADTFYTVPWLTAIAMRTVTILLACGVALTAAVPEHQPMRGLLEDSGAGLLTRRTLPFIVAVLLVLGYLCVRGQQAGLYDTAMGTAMLVRPGRPCRWAAAATSAARSPCSAT